MGKIIAWLKSGNSWKYLVGGLMIGFGADDVYCAAYAGIGVAAALELKNKLWGGTWDWVDFGLTVGGVVVGQTIRMLL